MSRKSNLIRVVVAMAVLGTLIFFSQAALIKKIKTLIISALKPLMAAISGISRPESGDQTISPDSLALADFAFQISELEKLRNENRELKRLLGLSRDLKLNLLAAKVLLYQKEFGKESLIIDLGKGDTIKTGDLVIDSKKMVVGIVEETGEGFSKVSIASNVRGPLLEIEILPLGLKALARGLGRRTLNLELIPQDALIRKGDFIFYKVRQELFPLGIVVLEKPSPGVALKEARATLLSRPEFLSEVWIVSRQ